MDRTALIVEDEVISQKLICAVLETCGFKSILANNGSKALALFERGFVPDLLLLDMVMPEMDGLQLLELLKAGGRLGTFPVAVFTSRNEKEIVQSAIALGADDYIIKPFNVIELRQRVRELTFDLDEASIRGIIGNLRLPEVSFMRDPFFQRWSDSGYNFFPVKIRSIALCVLVPGVLAPASVAKLPMAEIAAKVYIFRHCAFGWRIVWPYKSLENLNML